MRLFPKQTLLAGSVAVALLLTAGCGLLPKEVEEAPPVLAAPAKSEKVTYTVKKGSIIEKVSLRAVVAPVNAADLFFKNAGRLKAVYVKAGEEVQAGQVLAELFNDDAVYQLAQAEIRLEKSQIALADAKYRAQFKQTHEMDSELRRLELDLASVELDLQRYRTAVSDSRLVAPFPGRVMGVEGKPGDQVQAYTTVISVADPTQLQVEADVSESDLVKLSVGQRAKLEFSDIPGLGEGTIIQLPDPKARATTAGNQAKRVKVQVNQPNDRMKMGQVGKVDVVLQEKKDVLLLPPAAIRRFSNRSYVLMKEPRREVDVVIGIESDLEVEVAKGLKEGDVVVGR